MLRCQCGKLNGRISRLSKTLNKRFVCYCLDCQVYAHFLKQTELILDSNGGTEIIPVHPSHLEILQGADQLACVRLSSNGMNRWYTKCCQSPVANTQKSASLPFAGIHSTLFNFSSDKERESVLGPVSARSNGKTAYGNLSLPISQNVPLKMIAKTFVFLIVGIIRRLHSPSPFFDSNGELRVVPETLTDQQYDNLIKEK
jgi:hypothetical protein